MELLHIFLYEKNFTDHFKAEEIHMEDRKMELLFLDNICNYLEAENILSEKEQLLFRKQWLAED